MSTPTQNYGFPKPDGNENVTRVSYNAVLDTIDQAVKGVENKAVAPPAAGSITDDMIGIRSPDVNQVPVAPGAGKIGQLFSWLANRIKVITGKANWWDAPDTNLTNANNHINYSQIHVAGGHQVTVSSTAPSSPAYGDIWIQI